MNPIDQWRWLVATLNGAGVIGQPGVRDPEYPCDKFDALDADGSGNCDGDGHYMCRECSRLSYRSMVEREFVCDLDERAAAVRWGS